MTDSLSSDNQQNIAALETLLFIHGEPLAFGRAEKLLGLNSGAVLPLVEELKKRLESEERGLTLLVRDDKVQLATKPRFAKMVEDFAKAELTDELTPAGLEALAIIAYFGPISRSRIDFARGVNSSFTLRNLLVRGLVDRLVDPAHPASFLYQPSFEFLRHVGLEQQDKLPEYERFRNLLAQFEGQAAAEPSAQ